MTKTKHKMGDVRDDGMVFWAYRNGPHTGETWLTPENFEQYRATAYRLAAAARKRNPNRYYRYNLRKKFGLSIEEYDAISLGQAHVCAICRKPETAVCNGRIKPLAVDHCHATKKVRGLLCGRCNTGIGLMGDSPDRMIAAAKYLRLHGK